MLNENGTFKETLDVELIEKAILGTLISHGRKYVKLLSEIFSPEHFYTDEKGSLYAVMLEMLDRSEPIDMLSIVNELARKNTLKNHGGAYGITILVNSDVLHFATLEHYARILQELFIDRKILSLSLKAHELSENKNIHPLDKMVQIESEIREVRKIMSKGKNTRTSELASEVTQKIISEAMHKVQMGMSTSYPKLDDMITGLIPSEFIIIAGRPGMGKTAFVMCMAMFIAYTIKRKILFFSREMSAEQLIIRIISILTGIELKLIRQRKLDDAQMKLVEDCTKLITDLLVIDDSTSTVEEMEAKAIRIIDEGELSLIVVDYIQLCETIQSSKSREQEISQISRKLKRISVDNNIPVIGLSQLSRETEKRTGSKQQFEPQLSDLRESGSLEQDADCVLLLYRPEYYKLYEDKDGNSMRGRVKVIVAKQRNGATGYVWLEFDAKHAQFINRKKDETNSTVIMGDSDDEDKF